MLAFERAFDKEKEGRRIGKKSETRFNIKDICARIRRANADLTLKKHLK
jgi:hypothetical protein